MHIPSRVVLTPWGRPWSAASRNQVRISARREKREQDLSCPLNHGTLPSLLGGQKLAVNQRHLLLPHKPGSGSAEAQLLLNHFAGILAQNPPADHAL